MSWKCTGICMKCGKKSSWIYPVKHEGEITMYQNKTDVNQRCLECGTYVGIHKMKFIDDGKDWVCDLNPERACTEEQMEEIEKNIPEE